MSVAASSPIRSRNPWPLAGIALAALFAFWPALRGGWLWDDAPEIFQNPEVIGDGGLAKIWFAPGHDDYFPLKTTIEWIAWRVWGANVIGYHALSLALHIVSACLVLRLLARLGLRHAWLGGLLFAVHPLTVESVAWMAELKNTIALPPLLLATIAYVDFERDGGWRRYGAALGWFTASLLCKTSGVMLPVVLLLYHAWRTLRISPRDLARTAPFFAVSLVLGLVTLHFQHAQALGVETIPIGGIASRVAVAGLALAFYLGKFLVPFPLVPVYPQWVANPPHAGQFLPWIAGVALAVAAWRARAGWGRHVLFALGAFAALVAPVLGLVSMSYMRYSWVADHFVYLPLIPLVGLAVGAAGKWLSPRAGGIVACGILGGFMLLSRRHAGVFRDEIALWTYTLEHNPDAVVGHTNLGALLAARDPAAARVHLDQAIAARPNDTRAHNNLGTLLLQNGDPVGAAGAFEAALRLDPKFVEARVNLGNALVRQKRLDDAVAEYRRAIAQRSDWAEAWNNLGNALFLLRRTDEAIDAFSRAVALQPGHATAHNNLGKTLLLTQRTAEALPHYETAAALAPQEAAFAQDLGYAYVVAGRGDDAVRCFETALRLRPDFADAHVNLGALLFQRGELQRAREHFAAALRIDPNSANARENLRVVEEKLRKK